MPPSPWSHTPSGAFLLWPDTRQVILISFASTCNGLYRTSFLLLIDENWFCCYTTQYELMKHERTFNGLWQKQNDWKKIYMYNFKKSNIVLATFRGSLLSGGGGDSLFLDLLAATKF